MKSKNLFFIILSMLVISLALVFGFASCGNNAGGNENQNPNEQQEVSGTSEDGKYSYTYKDGILTFKYNGSDSPKLKYECFIPTSANAWGWEYVHHKEFQKEISVNVFDVCWAGIWLKTGKKPVSQEMLVQLKSGDTNIFDNIKIQFIADDAFLDDVENNKDYSKKTFTPKNMAFNEESAATAVSKMKMGANLSNHFESVARTDVANKDLPPICWETAWNEKETTKEHIKYLKSLGFTAIRIPVTWGVHLDKNDNIPLGWMNRVQEVVDWCMDEDLYVVLNTHHDSGDCNQNPWLLANNDSYDNYSARYEKIWEQVAERFKGYSEKLIFANANEVTEQEGSDIPDAIKTDNAYTVMGKWNQLFVDTVRTSGGNNANRNLVVSAPGAFRYNILDKMPLPTDTVSNHLIFEIHCYDPWEICGDNGPATKYGDGYSFDPAIYFDETKNYSVKNNIPVVIGEWGVLNGKLPDEEKAKYANVYVKAAMERGFCTIIWAAQGFFGYDESGMNCPKYLEAIKTCVKNTEWDSMDDSPKIYTVSFATATTKDSTKVFDWVGGVQQETYNSYRFSIDITDKFQKLPKSGDTLNLNFSVKVDKKVNNLVIGLVDMSAEANNWTDLIAPENKVNVPVSANTAVSVNKTLTIDNPAKKQVVLYIDYLKSDFDETATIMLE